MSEEDNVPQEEASETPSEGILEQQEGSPGNNEDEGIDKPKPKGQNTVTNHLHLEVTASFQDVESPLDQVLENQRLRVSVPQIVSSRTELTPCMDKWNRKCDNEADDMSSKYTWSTHFDISTSHQNLVAFDENPFLVLSLCSAKSTKLEVDLRTSNSEEDSSSDNVPDGETAEEPEGELDESDETVDQPTDEVEIEGDGQMHEGESPLEANENERPPTDGTPKEEITIPEVPTQEQKNQDEIEVNQLLEYLKPHVHSVRGVDLSALLDGDLTCCFRDIKMPLATGFVVFSINVSVDQALLSDTLRDAYNPMTITLHSVRDLPGVVVEESNPAVQKYVIDEEGNRDPFHLLKKYCEPVYACFEFYRGPESAPRFVQTVHTGEQGKRKVKWQQKSVILANLMGKHNLAEYLEFQPINIWVHDRDVSHNDNEGPELADTTLKTYLFDLVNRLWEAARQKQNEKFEKSPPTSAVKPAVRDRISVDLAHLDNHLWAVSQSAHLKHRTQQTHGTAQFRLEELWTSSGELLKHYYNKHAPHLQPRRGNAPLALDISASVIPVKRQIPVGGEIEKSELDIENDERIIRQQPGGYFEHGTELRLQATLASPVFHHQILEKERCKEQGESTTCTRRAPFQRQVFMFLYQNTTLLQKLRSAIEQVNQGSIPGASLRSYCLSDEERTQANEGFLDIITGFHVVDDHFRVIVIEGLAGKGMKFVSETVLRDSFNTDHCVILADSQQLFVNRLYTHFDVDLKVVRLREPLSQLVLLPEIYNRHKVDQECFDALMKLCELRSVERLHVVAKNELFPKVGMLVKLESKYGESVSLEDMNGQKPHRVTSIRHSKMLLNQDTPVKKDPGREAEAGEYFEPEDGVADSSGDVEKKSPRRKAFVDHQNKAYIRQRGMWKPKDFLSWHQRRRHEVDVEFRKARAERDKKEMEERKSYGGEIYIYSGQRLNCKSIQLDRMRAKLPKASKATYTFSKEFHSLAFSLVNQEEIANLEKLDAQRRFITPKGFVYPCPRNAVESRRDPNNELSTSRAEELQVPWEEHANKPRPLERGNPSGETDYPDFDCIPSKEYDTFGGYNQDGTRNPDFYRSVHLCGEGLAAELAVAKQKEEADWRSKVVVKSLRVQPHYGGGKKKPSQIDKYKDILASKPHKRALRIVRNVTLRNGNKAPLRPAPPTMFMQEPFRESHRPHDGKQDGRVEEMSTPKRDFVRYGRPRQTRQLYKRRIPPLRKEERKAPLFLVD